MTERDPRFRPLDDLTAPDLWHEIVTRTPRSATPVAPGRLLIAAVAVGIAVGSGLLVLFTFSGREGSVPGGTPQVGPGTPSPPAAARFEPPIRREGRRTVMDVTFPDGSTAEISYPAGLRLEEAVIQQDTAIQGRCDSGIGILQEFRHFTKGRGPVRVVADADGRPAEIWRAHEDFGRSYVAIIRRGRWNAMMHAATTAEAEVCVTSLGGHVDRGGWMVPRAEPPARLLSARHTLPGWDEVSFYSIGGRSGRDVLLSPGPCRPGPFDGDPVKLRGETVGSVYLDTPAEAFANWCADDLMRVHTNARDEGWVRSVIRGLRIDRVTLAD